MVDVENGRKALYTAYLEELDTYRISPRPEPLDEQQQWFYDYLNNNDCHWHDIIWDDQLVGFMITSGVLPNCHPDADYSICEAYIVPEYRRKGLMSATVQRFVCEHPGIYCLLVIQGNRNAQHFWTNLFHQMGATDVALSSSSIVSNGEQLCLHGFRV